MIGLIQRVTKASVSVDNLCIAEIGHGILLLLGIEKHDSEQTAEQLVNRILQYRIFNDASGRMNISLQQNGGGLLIVPQFTLPADTRKGNRPSFTPAADPLMGQRMFDYFSELAGKLHNPVACGKFAADMQVALINDGPVTFWLQTKA